jgi:hypothetical protein
MKMSIAILLATMLGVANVVYAQQATPQKPRLNPEQRTAAKEKWKNATPEERAAWKAQHPEAAEKYKTAAKEKWKNATPEERKAKRQQLKTNHPVAAQ